MPDRISPHAPDDWHQAFAVLPPESPPPGGWNAVAVRLDARRRRRWPLWTAAAACLLLAVALPWRLQMPDGDAAQDTPPDLPRQAAATADTDPLESLYAESAQLEALLPLMQDQRVASGPAALLAGELETRLAWIDAALARPQLHRDDRLTLWRERVETLRALTGFESTRRWLAANGNHYDPTLVRID